MHNIARRPITLILKSFMTMLGLFATGTNLKAGSLDVNDVSFLWPVPQSAAEADALISLADQAADGPIMSDGLFKALMAEAVSVDGISFPDDQFKDPKHWKIAGIRINPTALGSHPAALAQAEVPGVRLIVQPVTTSGNDVEVHDFTIHVVFNYVMPLQPDQPVKPDRAAFGAILADVREIKRSLNLTLSPEQSKLQVHPGFAPNPAVLTGKLRELIRKHLSSPHLDSHQAGAISFMGIPGAFEPWVFFKVSVDTVNNKVNRTGISGNFTPAGPLSEVISFLPGGKGKVLPAMGPALSLPSTSTAALFPTLPQNQFQKPLFPNATDPATGHWQMRDIPDIVANPKIVNTRSTDCVSCHTETTRRLLIPGLSSQFGTAYAIPAGISEVAPSMLPMDRWNFRNFGWGFNFQGTANAPEGFQPTVSQRAANEAAESADYINQHYPAPNP